MKVRENLRILQVWIHSGKWRRHRNPLFRPDRHFLRLISRKADSSEPHFTIACSTLRENPTRCHAGTGPLLSRAPLSHSLVLGHNANRDRFYAGARGCFLRVGMPSYSCRLNFSYRHRAISTFARPPVRMATALDGAAGKRIHAAFIDGSAHGLLHLATTELQSSLAAPFCLCTRLRPSVSDPALSNAGRRRKRHAAAHRTSVRNRSGVSSSAGASDAGV